jgi:hypothetical protein
MIVAVTAAAMSARLSGPYKDSLDYEDVGGTLAAAM